MCKNPRTCFAAAMVLALSGLLLSSAGTGPAWISAAYADDGNGDGDGDGDGDDGDSEGDDGDDRDDDDDRSTNTGRSFDGNNRDRPRGGNNTRRSQSNQRRATTRAAAPLLVFAEAEIVSLGLRDQDLSTLTQRGYRVLERHDIPSLAAISARLAVPDGITLARARDEVQSLRPDAVTDFNHFYRTDMFDQADAQGPQGCTGLHCTQFDLIRISPDPQKRATCGTGTVIGVIDTGINADHEAFANSRLEVSSEIAEGRNSSGMQHGTAVVALLIGDPNSRSPGLLPSARLVAIDTFHKAGPDERSDAYALVQAMDALANDGVQVINMSLTGPPSALIERMVHALSERGIVIVAAAGNGGPASAPVYPAAYDQVIAVTAVDRNETVYRRAVRGRHIDFAAPGVDVWTAASISGARHKTGTSFAAPFVSAAAALLLAHNPAMTSAEVALQLARSARDLGDPGPDVTFGQGLVQFQEICG